MNKVAPDHDAWTAGYERGVESGHRIGYAEGLAVLDDAAAATARLKPSRFMNGPHGSELGRHYVGPSFTPAEIRAQAARSWGLDLPSIDAPESAAVELSFDDWT